MTATGELEQRRRRARIAPARARQRGPRRMKRVLCVGECMLELTHTGERTLRLDFAGDTYNTAVYLRRVATELGVEAEVGYLTGLGVDPYSRAMRDAWRAES